MDRQLDTVEQVFRALNAVGAAQFVQVAEISGRLDRDRLLEAASAVHARHVALRRVVVRHEDRWWFSRTEQPPELRAVDAASPRELLEQELRTGLPASVPWRLSFNPGSNGGPTLLGFAFHHSAVDGLSGRTVLDELLLAATGEALPAHPEALPLDARVPVRRSPLSPLRLRWRHLLVRAASALGRRPRGPTPSGVQRTGLTLRSLSPDLSRRLRQQARANGASITGALSAASAAAVRQTTGGSALAPVSISVSLRHSVAPPCQEKDVGCFVTTALVRAPPELSWAAARAMSRSTSRQVKSGDCYEGLRATRARVGLLDDHFSKLAASPEPHGRTPTLAVSNRGDWRPEQTDLAVQKLFFVTSSDPVGSWFQLTCDSVAGELHLCVSHVVPFVTPEAAEAVADGICARLEELARR